MSNVINLSDDGLKSLNAGLDKLVASMDRLDKSLGKISSKPTFERLFGSAENFDIISKAISQLTYSGVKNFETLAASVKLLLKQMTDLGNAKFSTRAVGEMFTAIATIGEGKANLPNIHAVLAAMKDFINEGIGLAKKIEPDIVQRFLRIGTAVGAIGSGFRALASLKDETGKAKEVDIKPVIKLIDEISKIQFDGSGTGLASVASFLKSVLAFSTVNFQELARTVGTLQITLDQIAGLRLPKLGKIDLIGKVLLQFGKGLKGVDDALKTASVNKLTNVNGFASSLQQLGQLFATIESDQSFLQNAGRLALSFIKNVVGLGIIVPGLILFLGIFTKVFGLLATLSLPVDVGIAALGNNLKLMGSAFEAISSALAGGFKGKAGASFSENVGVFASNILSTLGAIVKIGVVFPILTGILAVVFKGLGLLIKFIPGDDALTALTKSIQRVGQTFVNIVDALGGNSLGSKAASLTKSGEAIGNIATGIKNVVTVAFNIIKIGVVFPILATGLVVIFKALSLIAAIPFGNESLVKVTNSVKTVALAFVAINEAFGGKASGIGSGLLSAIGNVLKVGVIFPLLATQLVVIFKALGLFSSIAPGNAAAVAATIKSFADVIGVVANSKIDVGAFRKAAAGFKAVGDSISSLTKSLVKKGQLEAFIGVGDAIAKILGGVVQVNAAVQAVSLAGILKLRLIFAAIGGAIKSAVAGLQDTNPELLKNFGTTAERLGSAVRQIGLALKQREGVKLIGILDIIKILLTFRQLLNMVKSIGKGADASSISAVAGTLDGLGRVFRTIFKSFEVKSGQLDSTALIAGRQRIDLISTIFDKIKKFKNAKLPDLEGTFVGLTKLFTFLSKLKIDSASTEGLKQYLNAILGELTRVNKIKVNKNVAEALASLSKLLSSLNVPASGGGVGSLNGIASLFESLKKVKLSKDDLNNFKDFVKVLASGLKKLEKVTVSPDVAKTIEAIALSLKNLGSTSTDTAFRNVNVDSVGLEAGQGFANSVEKGILQANLRLFLGKLFLGALAVLNPVSIGKAIISGVSSTFGTIAELKAKFIDAFTAAGNKLQQLSGQLKAFGGNLFNSLGFGGVTNSNAFQLATDFDALTTQVQVFGNLTQEQTKKAQAFANEIGIKYPQSANDALVGILNLQKAGLDLNQVFDALPSAADLASVSDTKDLDAASKVLIQVTQTFKEFGPGIASSYENASTAADILARSANLSTASVESLAAGLANVGPVANNFGLDLQETSAVLALFEDSGIKGAEGGTQLKSMLTQLTSGTAETRQTLKQLGVTLVDSKGNYKDLNTIINELNHAMNDTKTVTVGVSNLTGDQKTRLDAAKKAYAAAARQIVIYNDGLSTSSLDQKDAAKKLKELQQVQANAAKVIGDITGSQSTTEKITKEITRTQAQNAQAIKKLAGSYGQAGLAILINQGDDAIKNFIESTGRLPTAAEQASLLLDNLKGDMEQLRGSVETLMTRALLPLIGRAFRPLVNLGRTVVDFFNSLPDSVIEVATNVILLVSSVATFISGFSIAAGIALQFSGALLSGVGVILSMATNLGLVVSAVVGLVASFGVLIVIGGAIVATLSAIGAGISYFFRLVETNTGGAGEAFIKVQNDLRGILDTIGGILRTGGDIIAFIMGDGLSAANVDRGKQLAGFFTRISASLAVFKSKIGEVNLFLNTFKDFLSLATGKDLNKNIFESLLAQGVPLGAAMDEANRQVIRLMKTVDTAATIIGSSDLIRSIFGRTYTADEILGLFVSLKKGLIEVRDAALNVFKGLSGMLLSSLGIGDSSEAKQALIKGLSTFGTLLTQGLQNLTVLDLASSILKFKAGDVRAGALSLISSLLTGLKEVILGNEAGITNILTLFVGFFIPGKSIVPLLLNALGLKGLAKGVKGIFDTVDAAVRAGIGTIFDIMRGQNLEQALVGNFGKNIQPVIRTFKSLGNALGNLAGLFGDLFSALFPPGQGASDPGGFLAGFFTGVANAVDGFNSAVITPLRGALPGIISLLQKVLNFISGVAGGVLTYLGNIAAPIGNLVKDLFSGDFDMSSLGTRLPQAILSTLGNVFSGLPGLLGTLLGSLGDLFGLPILNKIGDDLKAGDFSGAITTVTTAVQDVVSKAVAAVPDLLIDLGTTFGAPIFTKLGEALKTGDFTSMAQTILGTVSDAIGAVPNLLIDLGTTFSSPLLTKIGNDLLNADPAAAIKAITDAVAGVVKTALGSIPTRLQELGAVLDLNFLKDLGIDLQKSETFQKIVDAISNLVSLPAAFIKDIADGVKKIVDAINVGIAPASADAITKILAAIGIFAALFAGAQLIVALPVLGTFFAGIVASAGGLLVAGAVIGGIAATFLVLKNAVQNLGDFLAGKVNFGQFIVKTLSGAASDVLKIFNVDLSANEIVQNIKGLFGAIELFIQGVASRISSGVQNIIDGMKAQLVVLSAQLAIASPDQGQRERAGSFFAFNDSVAAGDIANFNAKFADALAKGTSQSDLEAVARTNFDAIFKAFQAQLPNLKELGPEAFANLVGALSASNGLDEALASLPPNLLAPFMQRLTEVDPSALANVDFTQISGLLQSKVADGSISIDLAKAFVMQIPDTVLTPEQKQQYIDKLLTELGLTPTTAAGTGGKGAYGPPIPVEMQVTPAPAVSDDDKKSFGEQVLATMAEQPTDTNGTPLNVDVPVAANPVATLDAFGITTPASAQEMADKLLLVQQQADLTTPSLAVLTAASTVLSGILNLLVNTSLNTVNNTLDRVRNSTINLAATVPASMAKIGVAFAVGATVASVALNPLLKKLDDVKAKITEIANALGSLGQSGEDVNTGQVTVTADGKRKDGGSVFAGKLYEVAEQGISELLQIGGKTFLIPGQNGTVMPPVTAPVQSSRGGSSVVNNSQSDNSIGNISITIQGGSNLTEEQLASGVTKGMREYQRSNPVSRRLVLAGKT